MTGSSTAGPHALLEAARQGDRGALARLLSLVESGEATGQLTAILEEGTGEPGGTTTVGITGAPGAGKSTLTSALVGAARAASERVAVLAVDPSSPRTGGAILGDRVRMGTHISDPDVYIRSMATRGSFGGMARSTPDAAKVLGAVGFSLVIIETVGVGQVEVDVASTADTTVVVMNPGWGDSVQVAKAGIVEVADIFVINKADRPGAEESRRELEEVSALSGDGAWRPPVVLTVATTGEGVDELWTAIGEHLAWPHDE